MGDSHNNESVGKKVVFEEDHFELKDMPSVNTNEGAGKAKAGRKPLTRSKVLLRIIFILFALGVAYQAGSIAVYYWQLYKSEQTAVESRKIYEEIKAPAAADKTAPPGESTAPETGRPRNGELINALRTQFKNDEIVAYINIDDTNISYPVVQAQDNEYYLRRGVDGAGTAAGSIFEDCDCDGFESKNTVIYGHNMRNGSMFHNLRYFQGKEYFDSHRYITLETIGATYTYETFSVYSTTTAVNYIQISFADDDQYGKFLGRMKSLSAVRTDVELKPDDRILTLSTCVSGGDDNTRLVVQAKLIKVEE